VELYVKSILFSSSSSSAFVGIGTLGGEKSFKPEHEFYCERRFDFLPGHDEA
jgi:hypothetical protein